MGPAACRSWSSVRPCDVDAFSARCQNSRMGVNAVHSSVLMLWAITVVRHSLNASPAHWFSLSTAHLAPQTPPAWLSKCKCHKLFTVVQKNHKVWHHFAWQGCSLCIDCTGTWLLIVAVKKCQNWSLTGSCNRPSVTGQSRSKCLIYTAWLRNQALSSRLKGYSWMCMYT